MEGVLPPPARRGVTLAEQLAASSNLRDLLKLRDDDGDTRQLGTRRTLRDVIRGGDGGGRALAPTSSSSSGAPRQGVSVAGAASAALAGERRVSLMALLEQAERQWATTTAAGGEWVRVEEESTAPEEEPGRKGGGESVGGRCCVCMAHGKGAAFIPCGHTFCRACARQLRAGRGRCPLCNSAIREVLNLF